MRAGYLWLLSFLVYPIVGAPLLKARSFRVFGFPARVILSGGVGMVLVSWTMTTFALFNLRWGPSLVLVAGVLALALRRLLLRGDAHGEIHSSPIQAEINSSFPSRRVPGGGEGRFTRALTLLAHSLTALSLLAALAAVVSGRSTSPDLLFFWGPKAQQFAASRTIDADFLGAPFLEYLHLYYPPLVTNVWALPAMIAGRLPWGAVTLTFPLLLAATAIGLAGILKAGSGPVPAAATTAVATSVLTLVGIHASVAGNGESSLLFFEILAIALLMTPVSATIGGKLLAGLFLAGAATSKVEGFPFVLGTAALFLVVAERERSRPVVRTLLLLLGPMAVALGTWLAFGELRHLFRGYQGYGAVLAVRWNNLGLIAAAIGAALGKVAHGLPWLVPLALWLAAGEKSRRALLPIGVAVLLAGFLVFTYLTTAAAPALLISWSAARVFTPVAALLALAAHRFPETAGGAAPRS
ncbi:MAG TPA: hypothetical protein VLE54_02555 [Thermoanaerobaculia bacterium]|nr:hypothetical protein [Thermoanaerobaculia bacterium]